MYKRELVIELEKYAKAHIDCERDINNILTSSENPSTYAELVEKHIAKREAELDYIIVHIFGSFWQLDNEI